MPSSKGKPKPAAKKPAAAGRPVKLRPAQSKGVRSDGVAQFSLHQEMLKLLDRVSTNKSKRTVTALMDDGPVRAFLVALDEGADLEADALDGNISIQCLFGEAQLTAGRAKKTLHVGDLLVLETGGKRTLQAEEACVLLVTVAVGGAE